jgi:hypothetical protein
MKNFEFRMKNEEETLEAGVSQFFIRNSKFEIHQIYDAKLTHRDLRDSPRDVPSLQRLRLGPDRG